MKDEGWYDRKPKPRKEENVESLQVQTGDIIVGSRALGEGDGRWGRRGGHAVDEDRAGLLCPLG